MLMILLACSPGWAVKASSDDLKTLSVRMAIELALERSPEFNRANLDYGAARMSYFKSLNEQGWAQSLSTSWTNSYDESFSYKKTLPTTERLTFVKTDKYDLSSKWKMARTLATGVTTDIYTTFKGNETRNKYELKGAASTLEDQASSKYKYINEEINPEVGLNVTIPFMGPGKDSGRYNRQSVENAWSAAQVTFDEAKKNLIHTVREAYFALLKERQVAELRQQSVEAAEASLRMARSRFDAGMSTELTVSQAELALLRARATLADAAFSEAQARSALNSKIGLPLDGFYTLTDPFDRLPAVTSIQAIQQDAVSASGTLKSLNVSIDNSQISLDQAKLAAQPTFSLTSNLAVEGERKTLSKGLQQPEPKYSFGLTYEYPLGRGQINQAAIDIAQASMSSLVLRRDQVKQELVLDAVSTWQEYQKIERQLAIAEREIDVSRRNVEIVDAQFQAGTADMKQLVDARSALTDAQIQLANNRYRLAVLASKINLITGSDI